MCRWTFRNKRSNKCSLPKNRISTLHGSYGQKYDEICSISEEEGRKALDRVSEKWSPKYPHAMKRWYDNWDVVTPIFKFSKDVRKIIYTTNAIESLNSSYRKLNRQRSIFPSDKALLKALYLATFEATKKWTQPLSNWAIAYGELCIMYAGRLPD